MADTNAYAVQTQQRWGAAAAAGHFDAEICPVELKKVLLNFIMIIFSCYFSVVKSSSSLLMNIPSQRLQLK